MVLFVLFWRARNNLTNADWISRLEDYKTALPERITAAIENITSDYLETIQQSEDVNAPEDTRLAIIDILSRLDPDINLAHMA